MTNPSFEQWLQGAPYRFKYITGCAQTKPRPAYATCIAAKSFSKDIPMVIITSTTGQVIEHHVYEWPTEEQLKAALKVGYAVLSKRAL